MIFAQDRYLYPIVIPSGTKLRIKAVDVTLTSGTYYGHDDSTLNSTHPSFWIMLRARLNTVYGGTWTVSPHVPAGYPHASSVKLKIASPDSETINLLETTPLVRELLGFSATDTSVVAFDSEGQFLGQISSSAWWMPWSMFDGRAERKDSHLVRDAVWSSDFAGEATPIIWREYKVRTILYPLVFGVTVGDLRGRVASAAIQAGYAAGDVNNNLARLWRAQTLNNLDLLILHDQALPELLLDGRPYDVARLLSAKDAADMSAFATRNMLAADLWDVDMALLIKETSYGL